jgi:phosphate transport system substrate-binding protein
MESRVTARDGDRLVAAIEIASHGSDTAFQDLASGRCDVGMASRRIRPDESTHLASVGEQVIALDGIAIIVSPSNAVRALSVGEVADIFSGKVRRWSELGGADAPIVLHARDDRSGTYETFKDVLLGSRPVAADARRHESSEELSDAVASDPNAIGFIALPYVRNAKAVMVRDGTQALLPAPLTVATEDYPLSRRLYLYVPEKATAMARDFVNFVLSEDGQRMVENAGFVDLQPECTRPEPCASCSGEYQGFVRGACRVSTVFRFDEYSSRLDARALRDLTRVVAMMGRPEFASRAILLFGFSDARGARSDNVQLSHQRAAMVAEQFRARGLDVGIERGFGPDQPVADNATKEGRGRNRRVEIWLR